jgi:hypothetical protein
VAVRSETEMDEVEHRRGACHVPQRRGILLGGAGEIGCFDRHRVHVIGGERRMLKQALAQMHEVAIGIAGRSNPLVHLEDVRLLPGNFLRG